MHRISLIALVALCLGLASASKPARPATVSYPLFVGVIDLRTVPGADDAAAPATIQAKGVVRRAAGYPAAPTLSIRPIERLRPAKDGVDGDGYSAAPVLRDSASLKPRAAAAPEKQPSVAPAAAAPTAPAGATRRLLDASPREPPRRRAPNSRGGFPAAAPAGPFAGGGAGAGASLAASETRALHVTDGVLAVYALAPKSGARNGTRTLIRLQDLFAPVGSSNCRDGVYDAHAAYDPHAKRFYVTAACGGSGSALLAVSASAEPHAAWYLYNLNADGVGTRLACANGEAALVDYPRLHFNRDAIAVSLHSYCPSSGGARGAAGHGAALLVLPKGAASKGESRLSYPVFTSYEVAQAEEGGESLPGGIVQLEPVAAQREEDVAQGSMYFVADLAVPKGQLRRNFLLVALTNTGAMWGFTTDSDSPADAVTPFLTASLADRGSAVAAPAQGSVMTQPEGAPALEVSRLPAGFWSGRAVWASGKVWLVDEVASDSDARTPTLAWVVLQPTLTTSGGGSCAATSAWGEGFDFGADVSSTFAAAVQPAWEEFVTRSVNASALLVQATALYGDRIAPTKEGTVVAASPGDMEVTQQLTRTDVSPFFIPVSAIPRTSAAAVAAPGQLTAAAVYGKSGGRGGFEGWSCWSCAPGKAGFVSAASSYNFGLSPGYGGYNNYGGVGSGYFPGGDIAGTNGWRNAGWGGGPAGNFGPGPYGGGYGTGGWAGGYFGGFFSGSNVGGVNWGSSCQIMCQRSFLGTGGVYGWGTGLAPGGWGPFGAFPFGLGRGGWGHRRLAQAQAQAAERPVEAAAVSKATAAGEAEAAKLKAAASAASFENASSGVLTAQVSASKSLRPVCVAPAASCAAAARASCPTGGEPAAALSAALVQHGSLAQSPAAGGLALAAPALAVSRQGVMMVAATYSGAGKVKGSSGPAYPGVASITITPGSGAATLRVEQRGTQPLTREAVKAAGVWPVPPAMAVQAGTGTVYVTAEKLPGSSAGAWVSILEA